MKLGVEMIVLVHSIVQFVNLILIFFCMLFKIKYKNMHGKNVPSDIYPNRLFCLSTEKTFIRLLEHQIFVNVIVIRIAVSYFLFFFYFDKD